MTQNGVEKDEYFMRLALAEARQAGVRGEVPVGAVLVDEAGQMLAGAGNRTIELSDPAGHAEILTLREGARIKRNYRLVGCTLFVTLESCIMCAGAMVHARLARVVYGAADPKGGALDSLYRVGTDGRLNHRFLVSGGVLAGEAASLLQQFFRERRMARG